MASLKKVLSKKKYLKIKLKKMVTNHLELSAEINKVKGRFILDTGASNSCVGLDLITHFNLVSEESEVKAAGAGAIDMETQKSEGNLLKIGKWKTKQCNLVLFDLKHVNAALMRHEAEEVHGIIGADILEEGKAFIDYNKKVLYLKKAKKKKVKKLKKLKF
ncbi:retropepsin-like aspartic protease [Tenacibaculum maritimum]|uniref:retropepsin-like aspartic protease n=1 Tax=Tenacibaculum maritimum TaxID=107401 RepID=UPI003875CAD8